jgi:hypothetical protein
MASKESTPRCLPDTREQVAQTTQPFMGKLADAFRQRIALVKGKR